MRAADAWNVVSLGFTASWLFFFQISPRERRGDLSGGRRATVNAPEEDEVLDEALQRSAAHALVKPRGSFLREDLLEDLDRGHLGPLIVLAPDVRGHLGLCEVQRVDAEGGEEAAEAPYEGALQGALALVAHFVGTGTRDPRRCTNCFSFKNGNKS